MVLVYFAFLIKKLHSEVLRSLLFGENLAYL